MFSSLHRSIDWLNLIRPASGVLQHILLCYRVTSNLHTVFEYNDNRGVCLVMSYDSIFNFLILWRRRRRRRMQTA